MSSADLNTWETMALRVKLNTQLLKYSADAVSMEYYLI